VTVINLSASGDQSRIQAVSTKNPAESREGMVCGPYKQFVACSVVILFRSSVPSSLPSSMLNHETSESFEMESFNLKLESRVNE